MKAKASDYIEKDFSFYGLNEFEEYKNLINLCASDDKNLYRLVPNLLRTLFENLLYRIFLEGLSQKHRNLYFLKSQTRSRDFSELISVLNILKGDPEIKKIHKDTITEKTIQYLIGIRKEGNVDTHAIITQLKSSYIKEKKDEVKLLLDALLPFYTLIKGKDVIITEFSTILQLDKVLRLSGALQRQDAREIIENIKRMDKIDMGDLIVELDYEKLKEIIEKILAEIILIENFKEAKEKQSIYDFIIYSIMIIKRDSKKIEIFKLMIDEIISQESFKILSFHMKLTELLNFDSIKEFCIKSGLIEEFIKLYKESYNYNIAGTNSEIIDMLRDSLSKDQINEIIEAFSLERQLYESSQAQKIISNWAFIFQLEFTEKSEAILEKHDLAIPGMMRI